MSSSFQMNTNGAHDVENEEEDDIKSLTKDKLIKGIKTKSFKQITIMTGAGISVAAGIPDFRSPSSGMYANLEKYNLPYPEAIFTLDYFRTHPEALYEFGRDFIDIDKSNATYVHHFCKILHDNGMVHSYMTQNIDNLERHAGFESHEIIQAHGANTAANCAVCGRKHDREELNGKIRAGEVMRCQDPGCDGPVKPDIVLFGENLPGRVLRAFMNVVTSDLLIVIGTSLSVMPFNAVVNQVPDSVPKVLINYENTAEAGFDFENDPNRLFLAGDVQETILELAEAIGWKEELVNRKKEADEKNEIDELSDSLASEL